MNRKAKIQQIMSNPDISNNVNAQVKACLSELEAKSQAYILIDYVKHLLEQINYLDEDYDNLLDHLLLLLDGVISPEIIKLKGYTKAIFADIQQNSTEIEVMIQIAVQMLVRFCIALMTPQTKHHKSVFRAPKYLPDDIGKIISRYVSGKDWNNSDSNMRNKARQQGYKAAQIESRWQLNMLLQFLDTHPSND